MSQPLDPDAIIAELALKPHPEGGHYGETWRDVRSDGGRGSGTAIYYLLRAGERSHWHRVDATEIWHWYDGAPLQLDMAADDGTRTTLTLGADLAGGARPQIIIPAHVWQSAHSLGAWTLVGCTVSPAFEFSGFDMAPADWQPERKDR